VSVGEIPAGVAVLSLQQEYTAAHNFKATTLVEVGSTIAWDLSSNQVAKVTLTGGRTLSNPTFAKDGGVYILFVTQDGAGFRTLAYGSNYRWSTGNLTPTLTTSSGRTDILTFVALGGKMYGSVSFNYIV
jgi:hypothetical protein